jgi:hypothetical protein
MIAADTLQYLFSFGNLTILHEPPHTFRHKQHEHKKQERRKVCGGS